MSLLDQIATPATPATKFAGRPASPCKKCKCVAHWVNTMGGIQCLQCSPPPSTITLADLESRFLVVGLGTWDAYSLFLHGKMEDIFSNGTYQQTAPVASKSTFTTSDDQFDVFAIDVIPDATGAISLNKETGEIIFQGPFVGKWLPDEQELVNWFLAATDPSPSNSPELTNLTKRLNRRRISAWEYIADASQFLTDLRSRCLDGPSNPANCYGGLISDLRRLFRWIDEQNGSNHIAANQPHAILACPHELSREPGDESEEFGRYGPLDRDIHGNRTWRKGDLRDGASQSKQPHGSNLKTASISDLSGIKIAF